MLVALQGESIWKGVEAEEETTVSQYLPRKSEDKRKRLESKVNPCKVFMFKTTKARVHGLKSSLVLFLKAYLGDQSPLISLHVTPIVSE